MEELLPLMIVIFIIVALPLAFAWLCDRLWGDPMWLPHPVVLFGKMISGGEHLLNRGNHRRLKGGIMAMTYIILVYVLTDLFLSWLLSVCSKDGGLLLILVFLVNVILIFYCLAGTTLIREVRMVFEAVDRSLEEGRKQVARIVGRDTSELSAQEVRTAALETLAENLSDGVIAPLFWYALLGIPGMLAYKMVNTLDSMIGYKNQRYILFGRVAARIDDVANYLPARLTAFLMVIAGGRISLFSFVRKYGRQHASPNSGYPEAALAGILKCRFGGPHNYFGEEVWKPYIGHKDRLLTTEDMKKAVSINERAETIMVLLTMVVRVACAFLFL